MLIGHSSIHASSHPSRNIFFAGNRGTLAQKHEARFSSSICDGPGKDELELPIPMVCIVATTVSSVYLYLTCI